MGAGGIFQASQGFGCIGDYGKAMGVGVRWPWVSVSALLLPYHCVDLVGTLHLPKSLSVLTGRMGIVRPMSQDAQRCKAGNGYKAPGTEFRGGTLTDHLIQPLHFVSFKLFLIAHDKSNSTDELMMKNIILGSAAPLPTCIPIPKATCFNPFCF